MIRGRDLAPWLPDDFDSLRRDIIHRAMCDLGILEMPPNSNRSGRIDEYANAVGSPLGSAYCAIAMSAWLREIGAAIPPREAGSCDRWLSWGENQGLRRPPSENPVPGDVVLYGTGRDAWHCGVVIRVYLGATWRIILTVEANTSVGGSQVIRNGNAFAMKTVDESKVLCYLTPKQVL